jgi:hypothetical protein
VFLRVMPALIVCAVVLVLGWFVGKWWVGPAVYVGLALTLGFVVDPTTGPGEHDVARWAYAVFAPIVPALLAATGAVVGHATRPRHRAREGPRSEA